MKRARLAGLSIITIAIGGGLALAQHHGKHGGTAQSYADQQSRQISSFSDDEVKGHLEGRGLGYARPAELNGYPGPMHILELAKELSLTDEQRKKIQDIFDRMRVRAQAAGEAYIKAEKSLDDAFRTGATDAATISRLVHDADAKRAEKRLAHLGAHLEATPILTQSQRTKYAELRGYAAGGHQGQMKH